MTTETTEFTKDQIIALDLQDRLRAMSFDVIPATIVCGMAGISEGAYRARLKQGQLRPSYIYFGLRMIQVVPVEDVLREFFPDGLDEEAEEELMFGPSQRQFDCLQGRECLPCPIRRIHGDGGSQAGGHEARLQTREERRHRSPTQALITQRKARRWQSAG